ncbi:type IV pilus secretin PilQ family protein [Undibacterium sp. RTI2.1]|uniref:type IV pilus secretin PilQ family protein n=1 Tax=unclassified Undibacterium TaxID=2630295 RepID=UPI002AB4688B|nr:MULTISPECIES: type IV pilus secretin PilQ family protein [unclassified Undibacterium]MDY7539246.1 type IV pilus secretin PilQ family protein [Undibacterium sp. 5I1]MEB0031460.1 type IV pilus secretin PilQ family protein [Undibacterium sp. RTI2.1]MEB0116212.1 type IV pilus secretin PilQ family protein [Undibacterium sp. RTI2.2]MEB0231736.1 type IV pilus secretin PilQ family protein [Undibacterium sp. 10I3]MEB0256954.1 type IV pilus secretin PilQ family protein [Undibacterium sp. 5I1]
MLVKLFLISLLSISQVVFAQSNSIESVSANRQGINTIVKIGLKNPLIKSPLGFSVTNPARIALDFADTTNTTGKSIVDVNLGELRNINIVEVGGRSRLVFNMNKPLNYATTVEGNIVIVTIDGSGGIATAVNSSGLPVTSAPSVVARQNIRDIDFRRGSNGEGRIVIDLPSNQVAVDTRQQGQKIVVDLYKVGLPEILRRRLDVGDFGSPVQTVTAATEGENVRITIEPKGLWEQSAYQSDTQLVVEVKPIKEDPNKLTQGTQGYRGERLSFNFQNIEVRALLQIIAEFSGLNIIASDTVNGSATLRLKDVPWDQALDIIMQSKGLDMRKNGSVMWIAPKDELLTKEKLELEQKAQIAELEPLKTESFQLNYQKAEAFKLVFGVDGSSTNRLLSKRGSAVIEPRTNQLFVTDTASKIEEVRKLIQKTDIASRQVLIEARIVEADDTFSKNLGAKLGFTDLRGLNGGDAGYQLSGNQRVALTGNYLGVGEQTGQAKVTDQSFVPNSQFVSLPAAGINGLNPGSLAISLFSSAANRFLNLELSALEADGNGKIISSPRIVTADQLPAHIEQGTEIPYQVATSSGATSIFFRKATLSLDVTPQITPDGNIILNVDVHKDSPGTETRNGIVINTKQVKTMVLVENGGTVVLGGIFTQEERDAITKIPFLGDIPLLGNLFKTTGRTNNKTELLVFITPKVLAERTSTK